ncbi:FIST signal transduction protein [Zavarzinia sp. CC-PAN008]|uniref:FIST signal transduction protein n=1 Tax=Zavarzinia sp. CC-PAN008 TaxID=3243332 RepID=UPI003F742A52
MVALRTHVMAGADTRAALAKLATDPALDQAAPRIVFAFYGCVHDDAVLHGALRDRFPGARILGGTSCGGVMNQERVWPADSIGLLLLEDVEGDYGVASGALGDDPAGAAEVLLHRALEDAGCPGQLPELIWIYQVPGREEAVVEGLRRVVGAGCPIVGGSSADDDVAGLWRQLGTDGPLVDGLVVAALFPSGGVACAFQGGYEPSGPNGIVTRVAFDPAGHQGVVTKARGRHILEIDGQPAAEVYSRWLGDSLSDHLGGGSILAQTTMTPLAIHAGASDGVEHFLLVHPDAIVAGRALSTFATIEEGERIFCMRGDRRRLIERAGRVAREAAERLGGGASELAGGLIVYCGGCRLAVGDAIADVPAEVAGAFAGAPFLGCFTFGEQGRLRDENVHGNLMISAIAFGR